MKLCNILISTALSATSVEAFAFSSVLHCKYYTTTISSSKTLQLSSPPTQLHMSDFDFPSAMPAKPEQTMKEKMVRLWVWHSYTGVHYVYACIRFICISLLCTYEYDKI